MIDTHRAGFGVKSQSGGILLGAGPVIVKISMHFLQAELERKGDTVLADMTGTVLAQNYGCPGAIRGAEKRGTEKDTEPKMAETLRQGSLPLESVARGKSAQKNGCKQKGRQPQRAETSFPETSEKRKKHSKNEENSH